MMNKKDQEDLNKFILYWVCEKTFVEGDVKEEYFDHINWKYSGPTLKKFYLNLKLKDSYLPSSLEISF